MQLKRYSVRLKNTEDLDNFYIDMETIGGTNYIPERKVDVFSKRPSSKNTHYWLTSEEAKILKEDPRVEYVVLDSIDSKDIKVIPRLYYNEENVEIQRRPQMDDSFQNRNDGTEISVFSLFRDPNNPTRTIINKIWSFDTDNETIYHDILGDILDPDLPYRLGVTVNKWNTTTNIKKFRITSPSLGSWLDVKGINEDIVISSTTTQIFNAELINTITIEAGEWPTQEDFDANTNFSQYFLRTVNFALSNSYATDRQWGFVTCLTDSTPEGFDVNGTNEILNFDINYPYTGKNVDIVIVDALWVRYESRLSSPAELLSQDGQSYRVTDYNWYQHSLSVEGITRPTYTSNIVSNSSFHADHVASTAAGKWEGWAKDANVYFLPYNMAFNLGSSASVSDASWGITFDYIREWHNTKPINPITGRKNPTIVNNSWGLSTYITSATSIKSINYRGTDIVPGAGESIATGGFVLETLPSGWNVESGRTDITLVTFNIDTMPIPYHDIQIEGGAKLRIDAVGCQFAFYLLDGNATITVNNASIEMYDTSMNLLDTVNLSVSQDGADWIFTINELYEYDVPENETYTLRINLDIVFNDPNALGLIGAAACRLQVVNSGLTDYYSSENGIYDSDRQLGTFTGNPVNIKQRIVTSGTSEVVTDYLVSAPSNFNVTTNNASLLTTENFKDANTENFSIVVQRPCDFKQNHKIILSTIEETDSVTVNVTLGSGATFVYGPYYGPIIDIDINDIIQLTGSGQETVFFNIEYNLTQDIASSWEQNWSMITADVNSLVNSNIDQTQNGEYLFSFNKIQKENNLNINETNFINANESAIVTELPFTNILPTTGLTESTEVQVQHPLRDDGSQPYPHLGYWLLEIPFNISYLGKSYSNVYLNTASSISFGGTSFDPRSSYFNPPFPKLMISAGRAVNSRSVQRIYYGTEGVSPNREFRIIYEGHISSDGGVLGSPTIRWETRFFENEPNKIELIFENNQPDFVSSGAKFTNEEARQYKFPSEEGRQLYQTGIRNITCDSAIQDCIDAGIIIVASAGNDSNIIADLNDEDWNNYLEFSSDIVSEDMAATLGGSYEAPNRYYYNRGKSPANPENGIIIVGAASIELDPETNLEKKTKFSTSGPGVTLYAPGNYINGENKIGGSFNVIGRPRTNPDGSESSYIKISGTSMSSPQVTGILACLLEEYPNLTQQDAIKLLQQKASVKNRMDPNNDLVPLYSANMSGSPNLYLRYPKFRFEDMPNYPKTDFKTRPDSGTLYPRNKIQRRK